MDHRPIREIFTNHWASLSKPNVSLLMSEETQAQAVLRWFAEHDRWLLILDNADSEETVDYLNREVLPMLRLGGTLRR